MSIRVENLVKCYGSATVLHGISFEVSQGEFLSLLGPSGCGKTTTLRCLAGLEEADGGVIRIANTVVSDHERNIMAPAHERHVGMVFQSYAIWPHMSVAENVGFPLSIQKMPAAKVAREVDKALEAVGMRHLKNRQPSQLSGGQQQRVALARAIVGRPKVMLFDEPLSNLDAKLREGTRAEIRRLQRDLNVAAVYVTHDQEEALAISDRVIVMDGGRIAQIGTPKELYRRPINHFVADFVGRASFIDVSRSPDGTGWTMPGGIPLQVDDTEVAGPGPFQAMLRPEGVELLEGAEHARGGALANSLRGCIRERQYLGPHTEYLVEAAGARVKVLSHSDFEPGTEVTLCFSKANCRLVAAPDKSARPERIPGIA
jgi:ABC-type Fe3+/spermidine/putrescine transport system ATPase subunit